MRFWLRSIALLAALVAMPSSPFAQELVITDEDENDIHIEVLPAKGELLLILLVDHDEVRSGFERLVSEINNSGIEVWRVDLLADLFLERTNENVRTLPGTSIKALIKGAHQHSDKSVVLATYDRMPLPMLRGIRDWQSDRTEESRLNGAILFYPNLFGPAPVAGEDPELDPIVSATNIPLIVYQPALGPHRWRIKEVMQAFWSGGSPALTYLAPEIRDWFIMHTDEDDPTGYAAAGAIPAQIPKFAKIMASFPTPSKPAALPDDDVATGPQLDLVPYTGGEWTPPLALPDIDGNQINLDDYRGKVILLNFWATWCPPCVEEVPSMNQLAEHYKDAPFDIVSVDFREEIATIKEFSERIRIDFPVLLDTDGLASLEWKVFSFPSSFLLDKQGRIRYTINRAIDWSIPEVREVFDRLLSEPH